MAYQALYRQYRPTTFDEVVGQEHITRTLVNQIKRGQLSHAYLFTGTRGVGKTTVARILARAVNCLDNSDGNPCKKCENCLDVNSVDIIEMDAASNNGVDYARDIRDKAQYLPAKSKYKVYIVDEVHMLSSGAFNALLKTLEEPPAHVIFILCTTEVQKIPATILSRCMRFDFHLISVETLTNLLCSVLDKISVKYTKDAVTAIAVAGEGSARDALSIADRCVAFCEQGLTYEGVLKVLGATNRDTIIEFGDQIQSKEIGKLLLTVDELLKQGKSISVLSRDLTAHFRDLLVIKTCPDGNKLLCLPEDLFEKLKESSTKFTVKKLLYAVELYSALESQLRYSLSPRTLFEATTLKLADSSGEVDVDGLDMRLKALEKRGVAPLGAAVSQLPTKKAVVERNYESARKVWATVLAEIRKWDMKMLSIMLTRISTVWCEGNTLVILCSAEEYKTLNIPENLNAVRAVLAQIDYSLRLNKQEENSNEQSLKELSKMMGGNIEVI